MTSNASPWRHRSHVEYFGPVKKERRENRKLTPIGTPCFVLVDPIDPLFSSRPAVFFSPQLLKNTAYKISVERRSYLSLALWFVFNHLAGAVKSNRTCMSRKKGAPDVALFTEVGKAKGRCSIYETMTSDVIVHSCTPYSNKMSTRSIWFANQPVLDG